MWAALYLTDLVSTVITYQKVSMLLHFVGSAVVSSVHFFHREVVSITLILLKPLSPDMYLNNI
jgi:hypothetical protein